MHVGVVGDAARTAEALLSAGVANPGFRATPGLDQEIAGTKYVDESASRQMTDAPGRIDRQQPRVGRALLWNTSRNHHASCEICVTARDAATRC